jgi:RecJ-like exonuclease
LHRHFFPLFTKEKFSSPEKIYVRSYRDVSKTYSRMGTTLIAEQNSMNNNELGTRKIGKVMIIKKCHICGGLNESHEEAKKCKHCSKSFLPSNYFGKVHAKNSQEYKDLFCSAEELNEDELIKGLQVLW